MKKQLVTLVLLLNSTVRARKPRIGPWTYGGRKIDGHFVADRDFEAGKELVITTK